MESMENDSVDAIVTDPPYGLSKQPDIVEVLTHWLNGDDYDHSGGGFMGKEWDSFVPGPKVWKECLRVLKPGGYLLAFSGTRTQDLMGISLRLGRFEIRDTLAYVFGSGFPKSLDIGKAIDKAKGVEREILREKSYKLLPSAIGWPGAANPSKPRSESSEITAPSTPQAKQWDGWGTNLKPAMEPIILCRKSISEKTIAANVLKWGVGAINIDGCRIETEERVQSSSSGGVPFGEGNYQKGDGRKYQSKGRFPANLIHDGSDEVLELFPETGESRGIRGRGSRIYANGKGYANTLKEVGQVIGFNDSGSAARFFYTAKASKSERNAGLENLPSKFAPTMGNGIGNKEHDLKTATPKQNFHPTIKPLSLMCYLCRLITPPNGIILDPYAGSGSTLIAARDENFKAIGIELEEEYCQIAVGRMHQLQPSLFNTEA